MSITAPFYQNSTALLTTVGIGKGQKRTADETEVAVPDAKATQRNISSQQGFGFTLTPVVGSQKGQKRAAEETEVTVPDAKATHRNISSQQGFRFTLTTVVDSQKGQKRSIAPVEGVVALSKKSIVQAVASTGPGSKSSSHKHCLDEKVVSRRKKTKPTSDTIPVDILRNQTNMVQRVIQEYFRRGGEAMSSRVSSPQTAARVQSKKENSSDDVITLLSSLETLALDARPI